MDRCTTTFAASAFGIAPSNAPPTHWANTYSYDAWGNLWQKTPGAPAGENMNQTPDTGNHLSSYSYDVAGNMQTDGINSWTYVYDAENRITSAGGTTYTYDAVGWRVQKTTGAGSSQYLFDVLGNVTEELNGSTLNRAEIYLGSAHLGTYTGGNIYFSHTDVLGNERARSLSTTPGVTSQTCINLPFGDSQSCTGTDSSPLHFTGFQRDTETGLDQTWFRKYSSAQGRWLTPDPLGASAVAVTPQSWNRYSYVLNNAMNAIDPLGLRWACVSTDDGLGNISGDTCEWFLDPSDPSGSCRKGDPDCPEKNGNGGRGGGAGGGGGNSPANNKVTCSASSTGGVKQYVTAFADAAGMTFQFFTGLGGDNLLFGPDTAESQMMASSPGVTNAVNSYVSTGQTTGLYTFGLSGLMAAGGNPTQQFVGSFRWSITPGNGGLNLSLTNTTSFKSLTYDRGPQWQRGSIPTPMGNTHQTYNIFVPCK